MISEKTINAVFESAHIEDVVRDYLSLKRRGSNLIGLCPFHDEKTPSFMVSPSKNIFKCFGCGRGGGSVHFLMEHEKFSYPEAIRHLAQKYNIPVEETHTSDEHRAEMQEKESLHLVNQFAQEHYVKNLWDTKEGNDVALSYLKERGFLESTIRKFGIGFASAGPDKLKEEATKAGISAERMSTLGLLSKNGHDFFRNRVTFPIHNLSGKVIGFGARVLKPGPRDPKYLNSPESPVYNKRKSLYGLHLAKNAIRKTDKCYLVEGYTDVISMFQSGIENVVASSGTALTQEQVRSIRRFTEDITVVYDGDPAGIKAALRGLDLMLEEDVNVRLVMLPDGKDPDTLISEIGASGFQNFLDENSEDFILFKTRVLSEEGRADPVQKTRILKEIVQSIARIPDAIKRSVYTQQCAVDLEIDEAILIREVNASISSQIANKNRYASRTQKRQDQTHLRALTEAPARPPSADPTHSDEARESSIVRILVLYGHLPTDEEDGPVVAQYTLAHINDVIDTFTNPTYAKIIAAYQTAVESGELPTQDFFMHHEDPQVARTVLDMAIPQFEYSENWIAKQKMPLLTQKMPEENYMNDCDDSILRFKQAKIHYLIANNKKLIKKHSEEGDKVKLDLHLKMHAEYLRIKSEIEKELNTVGIRL